MESFQKSPSQRSKIRQSQNPGPGETGGGVFCRACYRDLSEACNTKTCLQQPFTEEPNYKTWSRDTVAELPLGSVSDHSHRELQSELPEVERTSFWSRGLKVLH